MKGILLRIRKSREELSPAQQQVADYILQNTDSILGLSVAELAEKSTTSKAAVVRFCKRIGCAGYRDFGLKLAAELAVQESQDNTSYSGIHLGGNVKDICHRVSSDSIQSIEDSCSLLSPVDIERAADLLIRAKKIDFYGLGASHLVAQDALYKFMCINKTATAYPDGHLQLTSATLLSKQDAVVAISWSGETKDVIEAVNLAKSRGVPVITITRYGKNRLSSCADVALQLTAPETAVRAGAMSSRIAQLTLIDILFCCVISKDYQNIRRYLQKTRPVANKKRYRKINTF